MDAVTFERNGSIAVIQLNRSEKMNAFSPDIVAGLNAHLEAAANDPDVRGIVLTGTQRAFCAGGDLRTMGERGAPAVRARLQATQRLAHRLVLTEKPVIAAVNGAAAGAGFALALLCDFVLASDHAYFKAGFPGVGAAPDLGLAYTLPRFVGVQRAKELLMSNRQVWADEAVELGLALRKVRSASLLSEAVEMGEALAEGPAVSLGLTKTMINEAFDTSFRDFLNKEAMAQAIAFGSAEFAEGVDAFLHKRRPDFVANRVHRAERRGE